MPRALLIGNSDGIGRAVTQLLLAEKWQVVGMSRSELTLSHPEYHHTLVDVGSPEYSGQVREVIAEQGAFDVCIYFAGIGYELDFAALRETTVFEVNLVGLARTVEEVVPSMVAAGGGHLVALSSIADILPTQGAPSYSATKAGMSNYLAGLYLTLKAKKIAVTNIRFGFVDTKMAQSPRKPLMISVDRAARVVLKSLRRRPAVVTHPRLAGAAAQVARLLFGIFFLFA